MAEIPNQNNEQNNSIDIKLYLSKIAPKWYIYLISLIFSSILVIGISLLFYHNKKIVIYSNFSKYDLIFYAIICLFIFIKMLKQFIIVKGFNICA